MAFQYITLASEIENKILTGEFKDGDRLPSLRALHGITGSSIGTVHKAYIELERRGLVEAKEKSGFFVKTSLHFKVDAPEMAECETTPQKVDVNRLSESVSSQLGKKHLISLGLAVPSSDIIPTKQFAGIFKSIAVNEMGEVFGYDRSQGSIELRRQIAKRSLGFSGRVSSDEIIITNGCMDAVSLCLRAVAGPGDVIGVESPTYSGFLQLIEQNNMYALELPTHLTRGVDIGALERVIATRKVTACLFNPTFQNPLGYVMPNENRKKLVRLLNKSDIPIIEDDIFGELHFESRRPSTLKSFDEKGLVLYCSSFSKTLAPGIRVGWTIPGAYKEKVKLLKSNLSLSAPKLNQLVITRFLKANSYERQLRRIRSELKKQMRDLSITVLKHFPEDTRIALPGGGLNLWVQLNARIDTIELYKEALYEDILVSPGTLCSVSGKYKSCLRLGCGMPMDGRLETAVKTLGQIAYDLL